MIKIVLFIILCTVCVVLLIAWALMEIDFYLTFNKLGNKHYLKKHRPVDFKVWGWFIECAKSFKPELVDSFGNQIFILEDKFGNIRYRAVVWKDKNLCSIHTNDDECVLCTFCEELSSQMAKKLTHNLTYLN